MISPASRGTSYPSATHRHLTVPTLPPQLSWPLQRPPASTRVVRSRLGQLHRSAQLRHHAYRQDASWSQQGLWRSFGTRGPTVRFGCFPGCRGCLRQPARRSWSGWVQADHQHLPEGRNERWQLAPLRPRPWGASVGRARSSCAATPGNRRHTRGTRGAGPPRPAARPHHAPADGT